MSRFLSVIFNKLSITSNTSMMTMTRSIYTTSNLYAEPLRKKKKLDPLLMKKKVEKKMKRIQREIRKLERSTKQLKPIVETQLPPVVMREIKARTRKGTEEDKRDELELQKLVKLWSVYVGVESRMQMTAVKGMVNAETKALRHLKIHSQQLYDEAISIDQQLIPFTVNVPKKETPAIPDYQPPDGKHMDTTKEWKM